MTNPEVLVLGHMIPSCVEALEARYTVHRSAVAKGADPAFLSSIAPNLRAVATGGDVGCPAEIIDALPNLEIIGGYGVGYDAIDIKAAKARGIRVTNTPDVLSDAVAELTIGLMLGLTRGIAASDRYVRAGKWENEGGYPLMTNLGGAKAGILGLGRIGKEIAERLTAFKVDVSYHGRNEQSDQPYRYYGDLTEMASDMDWLVVIAPGSPETMGIVSRKVLKALGPNGMLVNVARGGLIDQPAMVEMLVDGSLGGAALDVFTDEPRTPKELWTLDNVVLTPHIGSGTNHTRWAMGDLVVRNIAAHFAGDPLPTPVL